MSLVWGEGARLPESYVAAYERDYLKATWLRMSLVWGEGTILPESYGLRMRLVWGERGRLPESYVVAYEAGLGRGSETT